MFRVIPSIRKSYGYSLQWHGANCPAYIVGPCHTCTWYRYKRDAVTRAAELNKCLADRGGA